MIAEPHDVVAMVESTSKLSRLDTLVRDKDTSFTWKGYPRTGEKRDYSDGYGVFFLSEVTLINKRQLEYGKKNKVKAQQYRQLPPAQG